MIAPATNLATTALYMEARRGPPNPFFPKRSRAVDWSRSWPTAEVPDRQPYLKSEMQSRTLALYQSLVD